MVLNYVVNASGLGDNNQQHIRGYGNIPINMIDGDSGQQQDIFSDHEKMICVLNEVFSRRVYLWTLPELTSDSERIITLWWIGLEIITIIFGETYHHYL